MRVWVGGIAVLVLFALAGAAGGSGSAPLCFGKGATVVGLKGTNGMDVIIGTSGNDVILGLGGSDLICSGRGNDRVNGGPGDDRVDLGPGADYRYPSPGDDFMLGGPGNDRLFGGPGDDTFRGGPGNDLLNGGPGMDTAFGEAGVDECLLIEHVATCEGQTEDGEDVVVHVLKITHYHPPGAPSSFACVQFDGTAGATYVFVVTGGGVKGSIRETGTFGSGPESWEFDIFSGGPLNFSLDAKKGSETGHAERTYDVPPPGPAANQGDPSCKK